jgi:glycosyltransferase involved in cell wall biosynthesis
MISFVVPAFNEQSHICNTIFNIIKSVDERIPFEVIIVNDGSTDRTSETVKEFINKGYSFISIIDNEFNKGNAKSVDQGVQSSKFDYIYLIPGDNTYDYLEIRKLLDVFIIKKSVLKTDIDCIIGIRTSDQRNYTRKFYAQMSRLLIYTMTPSKKFTPNVGLILTNVKYCFPINQKFPKNFYHLGLMVNWRLKGADIISAGRVFQNSDSGDRTQSMSIVHTLKDLILFLRYLDHFLK